MDQDLKDYLDRKFANTERQFADTNRQIAELRDGTHSQFAETNRQIAELRDEVHQTRVLFEKLDDKIDLVAEGVQNNTEVIHRLIDENKKDLREHKVVIESAHKHLEHRVSAHDTEITVLNRRVRQLQG